VHRAFVEQGENGGADIAAAGARTAPPSARAEAAHAGELGATAVQGVTALVSMMVVVHLKTFHVGVSRTNAIYRNIALGADGFPARGMGRFPA
jgi:hypothetical protein